MCKKELFSPSSYSEISTFQTYFYKILNWNECQPVSIITHWTNTCPNPWVLLFLSFITVSVSFLFDHNLNVWVSSLFEFLSFITIWLLEFHHNLSYCFCFVLGEKSYSKKKLFGEKRKKICERKKNLWEKFLVTLVTAIT